MWNFLVRLGRRGNLFANLSRVVIEGSRGLGRRLDRQDEGYYFKKLARELFLSVCEVWNGSTI